MLKMEIKKGKPCDLFLCSAEDIFKVGKKYVLSISSIVNRRSI